jgi:hypothetical protein
VISLALALALFQTAVPEPRWSGDPEAEVRLGAGLESALRSTEAFGPWPEAAWTVQLHEDADAFRRATGAPTGRDACWVGATLHLRPWSRLQRRDLGALLRHELAHRRLQGRGWPRWQEEALCLWAEGHTRLPEPFPPAPEGTVQTRLDHALQGGTTASQRWAYAWLRAWLAHQPLPAPPRALTPASGGWAPEDGDLRVLWSPERLPKVLILAGREYVWQPSARFSFTGEVRFGAGMPITSLTGPVLLEAVAAGWRLTWTTDAATWVAAATEGELGREAPFEAKRALAAVLRLWLQGHPRGGHPDGSLCPLTHCAVVRGEPTPEGRRAAATAPLLAVEPERALFTGSNGGVSWSPREAWGGGSALAGSALAGSALAGAAIVVPGDPWATWTRQLTAAQVHVLKGAVKPGLHPGQRGLRLGRSGPYAVEALRLAAGRNFGWTTWPSNACEAELQSDGSLRLKGRGWGHNVGLCLATARYQAQAGVKAETILQEAFPATGLHSADGGADP